MVVDMAVRVERGGCSPAEVQATGGCWEAGLAKATGRRRRDGDDGSDVYSYRYDGGRYRQRSGRIITEATDGPSQMG